MAQIEVRECSEITPRKLVELYRSGRAVYRTPHLGNQYFSNLLLASIGLPLCVYEKNTLTRDRNYHPAYKIAGGRKQELTLPTSDIVVPYAAFSQASPYGTPAHMHYRTLKQLFGMLVFVESEFFLKYQDRLEVIFSVVARDTPTQFNRYIFPCGCMKQLVVESHGKRSASCAHHQITIPQRELAKSANFLVRTLCGLVVNPTDTPRAGGVAPSLILIQIIHAFLNYWESGHPEVFELAGPDMARYIFGTQFVSELASTFSAITASLNKSLPLPEQFVIHIVPTADFRFGAVEGDRIMTSLLQTHEAVLALQKVKRGVLHGEASRGAVMIPELDAALKAMVRYAHAQNSAWNIFYDINAANYFTHYDLLPNKRLMVPDVWLDTPFSAMRSVITRLQQIKQRIRT